MSRSAFSGRMAVISFVTILALCSTTWAQRYGQNATSSGFVPLADGPVAEGTTGTASSDTNGSLSTNSGSVALSNNAALRFGSGFVTLTLTNSGSVNGGLYNLFASLGNLDFVYETMTGALVRVTSITNNSAIVVTFDFSGSGNIDNDGTTDNGNDVPDANPVDDNTSTDTGSTMDSSPGNPFAN